MGARGAIYRLTLATRRSVVALLSSTEHDALLEIRPGDACPGAAMREYCNDDWSGTNSQVSVVLDAGTYWIYAAGCGADQLGRYTLDVATLPPE